jgi:hypothetical protein
VQVDPLPQVGYVLRALVGNSGYVVVVDEHDGGVVAVVGSELLHVDDCAIGDAAHAIEPGAPFAFEVGGAFGLAAEEGGGSESDDGGSMVTEVSEFDEGRGKPESRFLIGLAGRFGMTSLFSNFLRKA